MTVIAWSGRTLATDGRVYWKDKDKKFNFSKCKIQIFRSADDEVLVMTSSGSGTITDSMKNKILWHWQETGDLDFRFKWNGKDDDGCNSLSVMWRDKWHIFQHDGVGDKVMGLEEAWTKGSGSDLALKRLKKGKDAIDSIAYAIKASARPDWLGGLKRQCGYPIHYWQKGMDMPGFIKGPDDIKKLRELQEKEGIL